MTFPYNQSVPNPPNDPADDVGDMQINTLSIAQLISVDHVGFNNPAGLGGLHNQVSFAKVYTGISSTVPPLGLASAILFASNDTNGRTWPYWQNSQPSSPFQIFGAASLNPNGYVVLARGFTIQWGIVNSTSNGIVTFPIPFPNNCFSVITTANYSGSTVNGAAVASVKTNISNTQFTWVFNTNASNYNGFYWIAVGN